MAGLKTRWAQGAAELVFAQIQAGDVRSPFGTIHERADLRGLPAERCKIMGGALRHADFSGASLTNSWIQGTTFDDVLFDRSDLRAATDHGNTFSDCYFGAARLEKTALGDEGSRFVRCTFDRARFRRAVAIRPEFDSCRFLSCDLKGVDFNGGSFADCVFQGRLEDVWFRGGFQLPADYQRWGQPRKNRMANVDFSEATLWHVDFSNACDLSSVKLPNDGQHYLFNDWHSRLSALSKAVLLWPEDQLREANVFLRVHLRLSASQPHQILNRECMVAEFGEVVTDRLISTLQSAR